MSESRIERWRRTGLLQIICAGVVFGVWIYFQTQYSAAERPVILNEVLLLAVGWLGGTFLFGKDKPKETESKPDPESKPESEERHGRHAK